MSTWIPHVLNWHFVLAATEQIGYVLLVLEWQGGWRYGEEAVDEKALYIASKLQETGATDGRV